LILEWLGNYGLSIADLNCEVVVGILNNFLHIPVITNPLELTVSIVLAPCLIVLFIKVLEYVLLKEPAGASDNILN